MSDMDLTDLTVFYPHQDIHHRLSGTCVLVCGLYVCVCGLYVCVCVNECVLFTSDGRIPADSKRLPWEGLEVLVWENTQHKRGPARRTHTYTQCLSVCTTV